MANDDDWAARTAEPLLSPLGRRWLHVQAVAARAEEIGRALFTAEEANDLVAAAFLHDIGYAPGLALTGFHPLDGARFVRDSGHPSLAALVAHHTGARNEARLRGLLDLLLDEFPYEDTPLQRALSYCDLTNGPSGGRVTVRERVTEIKARYGEGHLVSEAIELGLPYFLDVEVEYDALLRQRMTGIAPPR